MSNKIKVHYMYLYCTCFYLGNRKDNVDRTRQSVSVYQTHSANMAYTHGACAAFTKASISRCHITAREIYQPIRCSFSPWYLLVLVHTFSFLIPLSLSFLLSSPVKTEYAKRFYNSLLCWINAYLVASVTARGAVRQPGSTASRTVNSDQWICYKKCNQRNQSQDIAWRVYSESRWICSLSQGY